MSNVTLHVGGRDYTVACAEGEESHVASLGALIDEKIQAMGAGHNEPRQLLFAALLLADELHEAKHRIGGSAPAAPPAQLDLHADSLEALAARLENCVSALEG
jgi:cell division protein ZapA